MKQSKQKGNLGFSATLKEIHKLGLNAFSETGDNSKIDLIIEYKEILIKIQIKYVKEKGGVITVPAKKSGPNGYRYHYTENDIDMFSVYLPKQDKIIFIPSKIICERKSGLNIRFESPKNKQKIEFI